MSIILYGPSLTLSQVTGLNIWIAIGACGLVCTIYTNISYMDELCNECDPLRTKLISRPDQLYPLFVVEKLGRIPGLTGLFISCILSATLSTFSSGIILQIFGAFAAPILGVYLLGLFSSRSAVVAFFLCLIFQIFMLVGSTLTVRPANKHGGRLPTSIVGCVQSINVTLSPTITKQRYGDRRDEITQE
ncbi:unnamed protein product [Adineta steineri]|uniref:Uncharacterized protein n=1 Tax=Adineta steineri TaxID=433720 RepID=A0A814TPI9_9BILA|nr:unnamed protein product [Adineta steineri]CAF1164118.1 unnamed protein product [Adineta steineri]